MENQILVFISSQIAEFYSERESIKKTLEALPVIQPWVFEYTPASSLSLEESYLQKVRECDIYILLLGEDISLPVRQEWEIAKNLQKPRLVFLKKCIRTPQAAAFIESIDVKWLEFQKDEELIKAVSESINDEIISRYRQFYQSPESTAAPAHSNEKNPQTSTKTGDSYNVTLGDNQTGIAIGKDIVQDIDIKRTGK